MLKCCDADCAGANDCRVGGYKCETCGGWFCASEMECEDRCQTCADRDNYENEES